MSQDAVIAAPPESPLDAASVDAVARVTDAAFGACPYLLAASGAWRSSTASREHRCTAVAPAAPLSADKQRRLCLTATHPTCATFMAAQESRRARGMPSDGPPPVRWAIARTTPVVDVGMGLGSAVAAVLAERRGWQAIPAVILVLAVAAVGVSGLGRDRSLTGTAPSASPTGVPSSPATPVPTVPATPGGSGSPEPSVSLPPTGSGAPTLAATPGPQSPPPSARTSYTVKSGDTLYGIARSFGTSVTAIKQLNGLTTSVIHAGQVLLIP